VWSSGSAVLAEVVLCITAIGMTVRSLLREIEPTRRSLELLHRDVADAVGLASRDAGRARAGRRLLTRTGNARASR
jgi:hypothetical protein